MDALPGDPFIPVSQIVVLLLKALEAAPFQRTGIRISDVSFDFTVLVRRARMDRQDGETVVPAECTEDGIDLGIDKASTGDTGLEVIQPDHLHGASKVVKSILDTANESLQVLPPDDFFIGVARVAQNGLEHVGTAVTTRFGASQGTLAEVDLHVLTGWSFHPSKDSWTLGFQLSTKPLDGVVSSIETMLEDQLLPDPLGLQSLQEFLLNLLPKGLTEAMQTRGPPGPLLLTRPGGHFGRF